MTDCNCKNQANQDQQQQRLYGFSPKGLPIVGTLDIIPGVARFNYALRHGDEGSGHGPVITPVFVGETELDWDNQATRSSTRSGSVGEDMYVDEDGDEWAESQISWRTKAEIDFINNTKGVTNAENQDGIP